MTLSSQRGSAPRITVYTKPGCVQCRATIRVLEHAGLDFTAVDVTTNTQARDFVMSLGYLHAPVVVADSVHWSGFRPDRISDLTDGAA
jgi:glutaredoxin-like protein NrdH